jgi:hypothetical protein
MTTYVFRRDVSASEWRALPRDFKKGEQVQREPDQWGLCRDDMNMGGVSTVPCTLGEPVEGYPELKKMFTVPASMLSTPDGKAVSGDYI